MYYPTKRKCVKHCGNSLFSFGFSRYYVILVSMYQQNAYMSVCLTVGYMNSRNY
jgi:hypothetical protein